MVTNTKTNVKLNVNSNQTDDTFQILDYVDYLKPVPKVKGKHYCPNCGKNDFSINKITGGFNCFSGGCKPDEIVKAIKQLAGDWVEKSDNNSFTSVSNKPTTVNNKPAVTIESQPLLKVKSARPRDYKEYHLRHDVLDSDGQVVWVARYENHVKLKGHQYFLHPDGSQSHSNITTLAGGREKILPFTSLHGSFKHLAKVANPERILIVEGEMTAVACDRKFEKHNLPAIAPYNGSNENLIPSLVEHLGIIENLKKVVLSPDLDEKGFKYMMALSKECKQAGYDVQWLLPYSNHPDWNNVSKSSSEGVDMTDYLEQYKNLSAEQFINQIKVISDDELERMLTGKTVTAPSVSHSKSIKELINNDTSQGIEFLAGPFIQKGGSNMILGYSGAGKSTLSSQLAITLVQGGNFLGHEVKGGLKVLCAVTDETVTGFTSRVLQQGFDHDNENLRVIDTIDGDLFDVGKLQELKQELLQNQYDVVIVDSLSSTVSSVITGTENGPEIGKYLNEFIKVVSYECKSTFVIIHHSNKAGDDAPAPNLKAICGHSSLARPLDQVIYLRPSQADSDLVELFTVKNRNGTKPSYEIALNDERCFEFVKELTPTESTNTASSDTEKLIIDYLSQSNDWTLRKDIEGHTNLSKSTCNELLSKLHSKGLIERDKIGKSYQYRLTDNRPTDRPDVYTNSQPVDETLDNTSLSTDRPTDRSNVSQQPVDCESIKNDNLDQSEDTNNVQNEVIENFPTSEIKDTVDTEKESKQDTINVDGKVFKTGDYYWTNKAKITLVKIARFIKDREGVMGIGPRCEIDKATGEIIPIVDSEYDVCLDGDVYPYIE